MLDIDIQRAVEDDGLPSDEQFTLWLNSAALEGAKDGEVCLRIVDELEITELNRQYRHKDKPTNVLSFPADIPEELNLPLLGDIVICAKVVAQEALAQNKSLESHWAHLCIHGMLHLQGYDHIEDDEAELMEGLEIQIMQSLAYASPYETE